MKKIFLMFLVVVIFTTSSFAQVFSDLPDGHWAKGVVEEMVKAEIISGYTDGTFRPSKDISKIESLILLSRVAGMKNYPNEAKAYLDKYTSTLSKYTTQYKQDVAYLMGVGILAENDLDNLISTDKINSSLSREEMAVLLTKLMGKEDEVKKNSIVILPFSDTSSISASAKPYVYYVYSEGIMAGMPDGTFSPKTALTRAQVASVLQRIYKTVNIKPTITPDDSTNTPSTNTPAATSFITGTITKIDTSASSVWIKTTESTEEYEYNSDTKFYVNSKEVTSSAMKKDATVTATITDDLYITSMNISEGAKITTKTVKGVIYAASANTKTISITSNGSRIAYTYDASTTYTLDGKSSTLTNAIKKDYEATLTVDSTNYLVKIDVTSPKSDKKDDARIIGEIINCSTKYGYIVIEDDDEDEYILMDEYINEYDYNYDDEEEDYYFDDDTEFEYEGDSKSYSKIATSSYLYKEGNYIAITLGKNYNIDLIEVATKKSKLEDDENEDSDKDESKEENEEAIIGSITKVDKSIGYIVIKDVDTDEKYIIMDDVIGEYSKDYNNSSEDFYFNDDTDFLYEGDSKTYSKIATSNYLYKKGYYVKIILGKNDYIKEFEVASKESNLSGSSNKDDESISSEDMLNDHYLIGKLIDVEIDDEDDYCEITIEADDNEEYTIEVLSNSIFVDYTSTKPGKNTVDFIEAYDDDDVYEGDRIMVILCDEDETALIILLED